MVLQCSHLIALCAGFRFSPESLIEQAWITWVPWACRGENVIDRFMNTAWWEMRLPRGNGGVVTRQMRNGYLKELVTSGTHRPWVLSSSWSEAQKGQVWSHSGQNRPDRRVFWLQIWCKCQVSSEFGFRSFYFQQAPQKQLSLLSCLEVLASPRTSDNSLWTQALRYAHIKAFRNFFNCNSDGH